MKILFYIALCILYSCSSRVEQCHARTKDQSELINRILGNGIRHKKIELKPASSFDRIIQYQGSDSWGDFAHTIRLIKKNHQYVIELFDDRKTGARRTLNSIQREIPITQNQVDSIFIKANRLLCNAVDLESNNSIDGSYFQLQIKDGRNMQVFYWQRIQNPQDLFSVSMLKDSVSEIVGDLMRLSEFPNGEKYILKNENMLSPDSIEYEVFLSNGFNVLSYEVYYNNKQISQDHDGVAKIKISLVDTIDIRKKIILRLNLFDKRKIDI